MTKFQYDWLLFSTNFVEGPTMWLGCSLFIKVPFSIVYSLDPGVFSH